MATVSAVSVSNAIIMSPHMKFIKRIYWLVWIQYTALLGIDRIHMWSYLPSALLHIIRLVVMLYF